MRADPRPDRREDLEAAYLIQERNIVARLAAGRVAMGRKVGLISLDVQRQLGVNQPDFGVLLDDFDCTADAAVDITRLLQPRIEAEIAFTLSDDITATITATDAPRFVHRVHAAFEIVESSIWSPESRELRLLPGRSLISTSAVTCAHATTRLARVRGIRSDRPVRRFKISSRSSAPRPSIYRPC